MHRRSATGPWPRNVWNDSPLPHSSTAHSAAVFSLSASTSMPFFDYREGALESGAMIAKGILHSEPCGRSAARRE
jgi:hypothetical protein